LRINRVAAIPVMLGIFLLATFRVQAGAEGGHAPLGIHRITPVGNDVPPSNQVLVEFDRPVVPLGRMERDAGELPIAITPALNCKWRWINRRALSCNLDEQDRMAEATRYSITVNPGITAMDGATTARAETREFVTRRPDISHIGFRTWRHPGVPVLRLTFNQPVSGRSLQDAIELEQAGSEAPLRVKASPDPDDRDVPVTIGIPGQTLVPDNGDTPVQQSDKEFTQAQPGEEARRVWLVEPVSELALDSRVTVHLRQGLVSALGPELGHERRNVIEFHTFPEFAFLGVRCTNNGGDGVLIGPGAGDIDNPARMCDPLAGVALSFSAPVLVSELGRGILLDPDLAGGRKDYDPWARYSDYSQLSRPHRKDATYDVRLPERLQAYQAYRVHSREVVTDTGEVAPSGTSDASLSNLRDEFGRPLASAVDLRFRTSHRKPNFELIHHDAMLESAVDSEVPLYVTNLNKVRFDYRLVGENSASEEQSHEFYPPQVEDVAFAVPLRVREMTAGSSGALFGAVTADPPPPHKTYRERRLFAQVTPYQVHAKVGHFNTLVWVTDLATGEAVPGATVTVYRDALTTMGAPPPAATEATTDENGVAMLPGTVALDPALDTFGWRCANDECEKLFIRVDGDEGMALMPLNRHYRVNVSRVSEYKIHLRQNTKYGHVHAWGTTAQGVYRSGDTIQFKVYVRDQDNERFVLPPDGDYRMELIDPTGKAVHEVGDIELNEFGAFEGEYTVPESAVMGWYVFRLRADYADHVWTPMRVLVSDFTPASFRVENQINGELFGRGDKLMVETTASLHSGGPYNQAGARVTVDLRARRFSSTDAVAGKFQFDSHGTTNRVQIHQEMGELTEQGTHVAEIELAEDRIVYGRVTVESAVRDDRGKYVAAMSSADYVAIDRLVGLRKDAWVFDEDTEAEIQFIAVDERGEPVADTDVTIDIERLVTRAARVKGAGNAYITQFNESWVQTDRCFGRPAGAAIPCYFTPEEPGRYRVVARIADTKGREHTTTLWAWVAGKGQVVWRQGEGYGMEIVPEKDNYRIGDSARFLIKNPFPGARALVTLERYGVIRQWQTTLEGSTPILEFPVEEAYMPGAYLSVIVFSPRVETPPPENSQGGGQVDLGKPAVRIGYIEVPVIDPYKQIEIDVAVDREVYKPGETVNVRLEAAPGQAGSQEEAIEYAVVVLDEAVFDLIAGGKSYFDPYKGFYSLDGLDVDNYSLLTRLVGRQKFEKKGASSGGDGGSGLALRTIFKYVGYWNPSLRADAHGRADFDFKLPDNLTGWRVLAMAVTPADRFGLGETGFKTNQPTEIRPVMPNQVTEGDSFRAGFSVMNRSRERRTLKVRVSAGGDVEGGRTQVISELTLDPYKRETIYLPVSASRLKVGRDLVHGVIDFEVRAWDDGDGDALVHGIPVLKRRNLEIAASYGSITGESATEPVAFPPGIYPDVGNVSVVMSPTVIGNVDGAFRYLRDYDYTCWEQVLTRGAMASHFNSLQAYLDPTLEWPGSRSLPQDTLERAENYQAPNGGMAYFVPTNSNVSPYLSAYTALVFNWMRSAGHDVPEKVERELHEYLLQLLRRNVVPTFYTRGMTSSVRAVALNALADHGIIGLADLARYRQHVKHMDLFGAANFLDAVLKFEGAEDIARGVVDHVMAHSEASGGKYVFNEEVDDGYSRMLTTQLRSNCAILSAFTRVPDENVPGLGRIPVAMARAITQSRGNRDHWENTQENMFCINALIDYSRRWENVEPAMRVDATLDGKEFGRGRFQGLRDKALEFSTPITEQHPGRTAEIRIIREGDGRLYYAARVAYSPMIDNTERINAGIDIRREYSVRRDGQWVMLDDPAIVSRGELVRVDLFIDLAAARNFVVVDDHVPGGLEPVNRDLATHSEVDAELGDFRAAGGSWWFKFSDWVSYDEARWSFYHREIRHDAVRFYADYLPPGRYHLSYPAQAVATGSFTARPGHAGEMYDIDIYGRTLPLTLNVEEPK